MSRLSIRCISQSRPVRRRLLLRASVVFAIFPIVCFGQVFAARSQTVGYWQVQNPGPEARPYGSYLGIRLGDIDAERAKLLKLTEIRGVEVKGVQEGSPADSAGIQPGDVLLTYNGENILGAQHLKRLLGETPTGRKIKVQLWRDGKAQFTTVTTVPFPRPDTQDSVSGFAFSTSSTATIIPRPLLVWRDILLGMEFEELDPQLGEYFGVSGGVLIRALEKGSVADKSGLKPGDVVVSVSHKAVLTAHDFTSCLRKPGTSAALVVMRNHKKLDVTLNLPGDQ